MMLEHHFWTIILSFLRSTQFKNSYIVGNWTARGFFSSQNSQIAAITPAPTPTYEQTGCVNQTIVRADGRWKPSASTVRVMCRTSYRWLTTDVAVTHRLLYRGRQY